jgi:DNA-binding transcriptional LysR family regulator
MSQQIASLETELDVILFERSKNRVAITPAGEFFLKESKSLIADYEQAVKKTQDIHKGRRGSLSIGYAGPTEGELLLEVLEVFQAQYPYVELHIEACTFKTLSQKLTEGLYDLAFSIAGEILDGAVFEKVTLKNEPAVLVMSKRHPKAHKKTMNAAEIAKEPFIVLSEKCGQLNFKRMFETFRMDGYEPLLAEKVSSLDALILLVQLNKGVSFLPKSLLNSLGSKVIGIEITDTHHAFSIEMIWNKTIHNEHLQDFITIAKALYA